MAAKKLEAKADTGMNKTGFIRSIGPDISADEIVAKGKAAGFDLTKKLIWTTQSEMRSQAKRGGKPAGGTAEKTPGKKAAGSARATAGQASAKTLAKKTATKKASKKAATKKSAATQGSAKAGAKANGSAASAKKAPLKKGVAPAKLKGKARSGAKTEPHANAAKRMAALVIELGTSLADDVYRSVRQQLHRIVG